MQIPQTQHTKLKIAKACFFYKTKNCESFLVYGF